MGELRLVRLTGAALKDKLPDIARLRISVFREWPYLYDGDMAYEKAYLESYAKPGALCVAAFVADEMVGASTGAPMSDHAEDFATALPRTWPASEVFYCAESVLRPAFRGRGIGHAFFEHREAHARALGLAYSVFASVIRPDDHPMRPRDYRPLAAFWEGRGYAPIPGAIARFGWKDLGNAEATEKPLQMWGRAL